MERVEADSQNPMSKRALWALTALIGLVLVSLAAVWVIAILGGADRLLGLYRDAEGWRRSYLLMASLVGSFTLVALIPRGRGIERLREVGRGHDRVSKAIEMAGIIPFVLLAGLVAGVVGGAAWPLTVPYLLWRRRRQARLQRWAADTEAEALRDQISQANPGIER